MKYSDKIWHFIGCLFIGMWATLTFNPIMGLVLGITAGIVKELWDKHRGGKFDMYDLGADLLGTITGVWIVMKFG